MAKNSYTVHELAGLAGISVRTLHHYDQIGLLTPSARSRAGYRQYGQADLLRLQQILFFRELSLPLSEIQRILDQPDFDQVAALESHKRALQQQSVRLQHLIKTIDRTILKLTEDDMVLTDEELYEGFTKEQRERYQREVEERYDPEMVKISEQRLRKLNKQQWQAIKDEGQEITRLMGGMLGKAPGDPEVQKLIARHHAWIENFYPAPAEVYRGLGELYTSHPEFRANYDRYGAGLADLMQAAMEYYCEHTLA
jgi:DNA-binding transcriptional MerR regulator